MEAAALRSYLGGMANRFFEWLGRVVMLSLAGMITLSIIGAIAAIPSGSIGGRFVAAQPEQTVPEPAEEQGGAPVIREDRAGPASLPEGASTAAAAAAPQAEDETERWLETIAYALLALVGVAVLATLILWRSLRQRRRIADALEAMAQR
jgi:hypothetical protein